MDNKNNNNRNNRDSKDNRGRDNRNRANRRNVRNNKNLRHRDRKEDRENRENREGRDSEDLRIHKAKARRAEIRYEEETEIPVVEQFVHPYFVEDPDFGRTNYQPSKMITRGVINVPQSYVPIDGAELARNSKLHVNNWMADIKPPMNVHWFDCVEVRFKNSRKEFFKLPEGLEIVEGDVVAVEGFPGHDIGIVSLVGELCRVQMSRRGVDPKSDRVKRLYRRAKMGDIEKWVRAIEREDEAIFKTREIVSNLSLDMKINDVEFQGDNTKAIFYYTADERVDFRQLIKILADEFRVRIEMKQIGARQEASRLGGIGTCGREFCCSTWINTFNSVTTQAARVQQLFPNPQKLAGQCGKLKCCLNFEYDVYLDELKTFPEIGVDLHTKKGKALYVKTDVLKRRMWYIYEGGHELIMLSADSVNDIIRRNRSRKPVDSLERYRDRDRDRNQDNNR